MTNIRIFLLIIKHKWFVFLAGLKLRVPLWRLLVHDWTKFLPCELPHYGRQFCGKADRPLEFMHAWLHHQNSNKHHWEYWIPRSGCRCDPPYPDGFPITMPEWAIREMVADWLGASRTYGTKCSDINDWKWLEKNKHGFILHNETRKKLNQILQELGYKGEI